MCAEQRRDVALAAALWVLVSGLIVMYLVLFGLCAAGRLAHPFDEFAYGESWLLDGARSVARGESLYAPVTHVPLMQIAYTPLYYVLVGWLQRVVGDSGYTLGRVVSLVATLLGAGALGWSVARVSAHRRAGLLAAGLFLTQNLTVLLWGPLERADALALGLTLLGLALATAGRVSLAAVVFLLALLTKQTYFVAPLVVAIVLWPCRRQLLRFGGIMLLGGALALGAAEWLTGGWFAWHTIVANSNEPDLTTFAALMGSFLQFSGLPLIAALAALALPSAPGDRLWRLYFLGSLATLPSLVKLGASSNYWLESTAAMAAVLALASCRLAAWPRARLVAPCIISGALLIAVPGYQASASEAAANLTELLQPTSPHYVSLIGDASSTQVLRVDSRLINEIARQPGELLTDNSGLAVAAGKRISFEFQIFQLLEAEGHWSEQPILDAVAAQQFALVALMHPLDTPISATRWTPALRDALQRAYVAAGTESGFWLYRPRR